MRAPTLSVEDLRKQVDVVKQEILLNVLNRPLLQFDDENAGNELATQDRA